VVLGLGSAYCGLLKVCFLCRGTLAGRGQALVLQAYICLSQGNHGKCVKATNALLTDKECPPALAYYAHLYRADALLSSGTPHAPLALTDGQLY
jgi:hypothetical protein